MVFEDTEENKLIYTDIHKEYVSVFTCLQPRVLILCLTHSLVLF